MISVKTGYGEDIRYGEDVRYDDPRALIDRVRVVVSSAATARATVRYETSGDTLFRRI